MLAVFAGTKTQTKNLKFHQIKFHKCIASSEASMQSQHFRQMALHAFPPCLLPNGTDAVQKKHGCTGEACSGNKYHDGICQAPVQTLLPDNMVLYSDAACLLPLSSVRHMGQVPRVLLSCLEALHFSMHFTCKKLLQQSINARSGMRC